MSPSARSMKWLRDNGFIAAKVEQILHMPKSPFPFKRDCWGFGDVLAAHPNQGTFLIQVTSGSNVSKRCDKIINDPKVAPVAAVWLSCGNRISVHGWAKKGKRGKVKRWTLTQKTILLLKEMDNKLVIQ